jgi:hypothetical protein
MDSKLIKKEVTKSEMDMGDIKSFLKEDKVEEELDEIRYFEYSSDEDGEVFFF